MAQADINAQIEEWIKLNIEYGRDVQSRLEYRLVQENGKLVWKRLPRIPTDSGTVKASDRTVQDFAREEASGWYEAQKGAIDGLFTLGMTEAMRDNAALLGEDYTEKWAKDWLKSSSELYRQDEGLYRKFGGEKLKSLCVDEGYDRISTVITQGIRDNTTPGQVIRNIREKVFGLAPGQIGKSLTFRAETIMRTELKYSKRLTVIETARKDPRILGVRIRYYGGPCPSNVCINALRGGRNFKIEGAEAVADFYFEDGPVPYSPMHPRCHCTETRFLYAVDREREMKRERAIEVEKEMPAEKAVGIPDVYDRTPESIPAGESSTNESLTAAPFIPRVPRTTGGGGGGGTPPRNVIKEVKADEFKKAIDTLPDFDKFYITEYGVEDYEKMRTFLWEDSAGYGTAGYAVKNGELVSVFNASATRGAGSICIEDAVKSGLVDRLDCYGERLESIYREFGFTTVSKDDFNPEYANRYWNEKKHGRPKYIAMKLEKYS